MEISCNYSLSPLNQVLIGSRLVVINYQRGFLSIDNMSFSGIGFLGISFINDETKEYYSFKLFPAGQETMAGNVFGFDIEKIHHNKGDTMQSYGFQSAILFNDLHSTVQKIIGMGEQRVYDVEDLSTFGFWYGENVQVENVHVNKRTLDVIGILLSDNTWLYIISGGEGYYDLHFRSKDQPKAFVVKQGYPDMDRELTVLEEIGN